MQSFTQSSSRINNQPLDFTSKNNNVEPFILDLSCKKKPNQEMHQPQNRLIRAQKRPYDQAFPYNLSPVPFEMYSMLSSRETTSPIFDRPDQSQQTPYTEEKKNQMETRGFMVTPPSEPSDSPNKAKYDTMYPMMNLSTSDMSPLYPGSQFLNMPLHVTPVLSNFLNTDNMSPIYMPAMQTPPNMTATSTSSNEHDDPTVSTSPESSKKGPRPFKAYPKDPLSLSIGLSEYMQDLIMTEDYIAFRKRMLESVSKTNEGTNIKMRRISKSPASPTSTMDDKDAAYWERRRKNNEAAKRSRDARRAKEDEIAIRAAYLEQENMKLRYEINRLRRESAKCRCMCKR